MGNITLITGATGFIGSHLVDFLVQRGRNIRCLVRRTSGNVEYLKSLGVELVYGDILDKESLRRAVRNVNVVYHLAAKVRPSKIIEKLKEDSNLYLKVNLIGTKNLIEFCLNNGIQKFIYFSSIAAAGPGSGLTEESLPSPITDYGKSKFEAEKYILSLSRTKNFPALIIRPAQIYGPRGLAMLILFRFIKKGIVPVIGNGFNSIPFCYIDDLVKTTLMIEDKGKIGEIYFVVEKSYTVKELIETIMKVIGTNCIKLSLPKTIVYGATLFKDIFEKILYFRIHPFYIDINRNTIRTAFTNWVCSNNKINRELGYVPKIDLEKGINIVFNWYKENGLL